MIALKAQKRESAGKYTAFNLRKEGIIPGVVYGKGSENINVQMVQKDLEKLIDSGERILNLDVDGEVKNVVLKDIQHGTFDWEVLHADFRLVDATTKVHLMVAVELEGDAAGLDIGGVVEHLLHEVEVECVPGDLPDRIHLNIEPLKVHDVWYVSNLPAIKGVTYATASQVAVVSCHLPAGEKSADSAADDEAAAEGEAAAE